MLYQLVLLICLEDIDFTNDKKEVEEKKPADLEKFLNQSEVMFDGEVMKLDEEDRQEIRNALEFIFYKAKKKNKRKE